MNFRLITTNWPHVFSSFPSQHSTKTTMTKLKRHHPPGQREFKRRKWQTKILAQVWSPEHWWTSVHTSRHMYGVVFPCNCPCESVLQRSTGIESAGSLRRSVCVQAGIQSREREVRSQFPPLPPPTPFPQNQVTGLVLTHHRAPLPASSGDRGLFSKGSKCKRLRILGSQAQQRTQCGTRQKI